MTTNANGRARRRALVRLSVVTGSALTVAASWFGVVRADHATGDAPSVRFEVPASAPGASADLVPAPTTARQVVVVGRSQAS